MIYLILTYNIYIKSFILLLIIKLKNYFKIFGYLKLKKYEIIINIIYNFLTFWPGYYIYVKDFLFIILN